MSADHADKGKSGAKGESAPSAVERLVEGLAHPEGGQEVEAGRFTVARERAAELAQKYRLADPYRYVLMLVQAAELQGADQVELEVRRRSLRLTFDGSGFSYDDLDRLYDSVLDGGATGRAGARHHLALGIGAVKELAPRSLKLVSGRAGEGVQLTWRPGEEERLERIDSASTSGRGRFLGTRLEVAFGKAEPRSREAREGAPRPEAALVRDRCRYADCVVHLNGELVSGERELRRREDREPITGEGGVRGGLAANHDPSAPTEIRVVQAGVWVATVRPPHLPRGFVAVVASRELRLDLSLSRVVEDEAWARATAAVTAAAEKMKRRQDLDELRRAAARAALRPALEAVLVWGGRRFRNGWLTFVGGTAGFWLVIGTLIWPAMGLNAASNVFFSGLIATYIIGALAVDYFLGGMTAQRCHDRALALELPKGTTADDAVAALEDLQREYASTAVGARLARAMIAAFRRR